MDKISKPDAMLFSIIKWEFFASHPVPELREYDTLKAEYPFFQHLSSCCGMCELFSGCVGCPFDEADDNCREYNSSYMNWINQNGAQKILDFLLSICDDEEWRYE
jgi:hypothetical protein